MTDSAAPDHLKHRCLQVATKEQVMQNVQNTSQFADLLYPNYPLPYFYLSLMAPEHNAECKHDRAKRKFSEVIYYQFPVVLWTFSLETACD